MTYTCCNFRCYQLIVCVMCSRNACNQVARRLFARALEFIAKSNVRIHRLNQLLPNFSFVSFQSPLFCRLSSSSRSIHRLLILFDEHISSRNVFFCNIRPLFDHCVCFSRHFNFLFFVSTSSMPVIAIASHRFLRNFLATNICFALITFGMQNEYFIASGFACSSTAPAHFSQLEHLDGGPLPLAAQEKRKMSMESRDAQWHL